MQLRIAICTVSDRASRGERPDASGPALAELVTAKGWEVTRQTIVPDDREIIAATLTAWADLDDADIILTTGGTGFAPRDVTPEATLAVIEREAPGLAEAMRAASATKSRHAMLSRAIAGIRRATLIVNLPGNPNAAVENFEVIAATLEHAIQLLQDKPSAEAGH
jgi:molybdopterin adenylyltransferase